MTMNELLSILKSYQEYKNECIYIDSKLENIKSTTDYSETPGGTPIPNDSKWNNLILKKEQYESKMDEIIDMIDLIDNPTYRIVIYRKFIMNEKLEVIADLIGYSSFYVRNSIYKSAKNELLDKINKK